MVLVQSPPDDQNIIRFKRSPSGALVRQLDQWFLSTKNHSTKNPYCDRLGAELGLRPSAG